MRVVAMLLIIALFLGGCLGGVNSPNDKATKITVKKVDLFQGKDEKYKPFLGNMSGAFQVKYKGNKPNATLELEIWEKGQKTESAGAIYDLFFNSKDSQSGEMEVIISNEIIALTDHAQFMKTKISMISETGTTHTSVTHDWDEKWNGYGLISGEEEQTFSVDESTSAHVFGIHTTSNNQIHTVDFSSPESLKRMEYALVFTLYIEKE